MRLVNPIVDVRLLRTRWLLTVGLAIGGAFMVVASYAFGAATATGIGFAVSIGLVVVAAGLLVTSRRARQYLSVPARSIRLAAWELVSLAAVAIAAWNVVQTRVFDAATARWLMFADGLAVVAVALVALVLHELSTERVVHSLEVVDDEASAQAERVAA